MDEEYDVIVLGTGLKVYLTIIIIYRCFMYVNYYISLFKCYDYYIL